MNRVLVTLLSLLVAAGTARADVQTFENDYDGFVEAASSLSVIDFETDPNGEPIQDDTGPLTDTFNYDMQGIHFSSGYPYPPWPYPMFDGGPPFDLAVLAPVFEHTWIVGESTTPAMAIGGFFPGDTTLCAFDELGSRDRLRDLRSTWERPLRRHRLRYRDRFIHV